MIDQNPTVYGTEGAVGPLYESDSKPVVIEPQELVGKEKADPHARELPAEHVAQELAGRERKGIHLDIAKELPLVPPVERIVYEPAAARSVKIAKKGR
jgi:hypothetical protein